MKKAHELSVLCNLKIAISFYDPSLGSLVEFSTDPSFSMRDHVRLTTKNTQSSSRKINYKFLTPQDFDDYQGKFVRSTNFDNGDCEQLKPIQGK